MPSASIENWLVNGFLISFSMIPATFLLWLSVASTSTSRALRGSNFPTKDEEMVSAQSVGFSVPTQNFKISGLIPFMASDASETKLPTRVEDSAGAGAEAAAVGLRRLRPVVMGLGRLRLRSRTRVEGTALVQDRRREERDTMRMMLLLNLKSILSLLF